MNDRSRRVRTGVMAATVAALLMGLAGTAAADRKPSHYDRGKYYPERGRHVDRAPRAAVEIRHRTHPYYYHRGTWYRPDGPRFLVVAPPLGLVVPVLPRYYSTFWFGGYPYYYANDVYYVYRPQMQGYVVTAPPPVAETVGSTPASELFVYPMEGQDEPLQASDRYECHAWAVRETGFDPVRPQGGVGAADWSRKREDYQRALAACLTGRGYSVR